MTGAPEIVVFYWQGSPWASKVISYLNLRGLPYTECHQPITMPRPDLADVGVTYRRIPVVAIGRDIYCDTLLILEKLESLFPSTDGKSKTLTGQTVEQKAMEKLLEKWTDVVVFRQAADCIPLDHPLVSDPKFIEDRSQLWGESWERKDRAKRKPDALVHMRALFDFLEETMMSDGREWVLGTKGPMLADIHSAWIFSWMMSLDDSWPEDIISKSIYPKTYAWCDRYTKAVADATESNPKPKVISGAEALDHLAAVSFAEDQQRVDEKDPLGLKKGQEVVVTPLDTGFTAKEKGPLWSLTSKEVVTVSKTKTGTEVHVHAPRWNFKIVAAA